MMRIVRSGHFAFALVVFVDSAATARVDMWICRPWLVVWWLAFGAGLNFGGYGVYDGVEVDVM